MTNDPFAFNTIKKYINNRLYKFYVKRCKCALYVDYYFSNYYDLETSIILKAHGGICASYY